MLNPPEDRRTVTYTQKYHPYAFRYFQPLTFGNISELGENLVEDFQYILAFYGKPKEVRPLTAIEEMKQGKLEENETTRLLEEMAFFSSCSTEAKLAYGHTDLT